MDPKRPKPRYNIITMAKLKDKEGILKAKREKQLVTYKGAPIRRSSDFLTEKILFSSDRHEAFKVMKIKDLQPRLLCPEKLSFKIKGEMKSFTDKKKLNQFVTTKPVLQQMLKGLL